MNEHDDDPRDAPKATEDAPTDHDADARAHEAERVRQIILARRNRFMAAALAGAGMTLGGCKDCGPSVCLSMANCPDGTDTPPCDSTTPLDDASAPDRDSGTAPADAGEASLDAGVEKRDAGGIPPGVCLTPID